MFFLVVTAVILIVTYIINTVVKPKNFPPGPQWFPLVGSLPELKKYCKANGGQYKAFTAMAKDYKTNVVGLKLGKELVVAVLSFPVVRTILRSDVFQARPDNFFIRLRSMGTRKGITGTDGELWTVQRNFLIRHLRDLGFGKQPVELMLHDELDDILDIIKEQGPQIEIGKIIAPSVLNVLWALTAGSRISRKDPRLNRLLDLLRRRTVVFDMSGGTLTQHPWLRFIAPERTGYNLLMEVNNGLRNFIMEAVNEHYDNWTEGRDDDVIYSFITEMRQRGEVHSSFTEDQLVMVCLDIFVAGSQTTSHTLDFAFLLMLMHPDIQAKVQERLDTALEKDARLQYIDRLKVPYVEAVLLEAERYCHVVPITGPRRAVHDTILDGHFIPKDTTILISSYSVHMDKDFWGDPEVFRPERFLDANGQLSIPDRSIPFGLGKRRCIGESLAKNCIFLFFAGILRHYTIAPVPGKDMPTGIALPGITLSPEKYAANFIKRK